VLSLRQAWAGRRTIGDEVMPLSDFEMASTRRIPYGTRITAGMGNMHTRIGDLAASEPEKKVALHQGCCSLRQTVLTAMSLTHVAKRQEKGRMQDQSHAVGADNAVSTGGTSVKRRNDGIKMLPRCLKSPHTPSSSPSDGLFW